MAIAERILNSGFEPRIGRSVSLDHAAELLGVSRRTIYNRIRDGRLQTIRTLGGSQRVLLDSVDEERARPARARSCSGVRLKADPDPATPFPSVEERHEPELSILSVGLRRRRLSGSAAPLCTSALVILLTAAPAAAQRAPGAPERRPRRSPRGRIRRPSTSSSHGDAARSTRSPPRYNVVVTRWLEERRGAARQRRPARGAAAGRGGRSSVGRHPRSGRRRPTATVEPTRGEHRRRSGVGRRRRPAAADGQGRHRGGDRLGDRHAAQRAQGPRARDAWTSPAATAWIGSATARTWRRSSPGRRADARTRATYRGIAPGAYLLNLRVLGDDGSGTASDVIEAIDWAIEHRARVQHPGHQPVARRAGAAAVPRRSAVRGGRAGGAGGHRRRGGGGQLRADGGRAGRCIGGDHVAGQQPVCADGGGARHARHGGSGRTTRWRRTARRGRRGTTWCMKPDVVGAGAAHIVSAEAAGVVSVGDVSRSGTWRGAGRTPTSSCRGRAWRRRW